MKQNLRHKLTYNKNKVELEAVKTFRMKYKYMY